MINFINIDKTQRENYFALCFFGVTGMPATCGESPLGDIVADKPQSNSQGLNREVRVRNCRCRWYDYARICGGTDWSVAEIGRSIA